MTSPGRELVLTEQANCECGEKFSFIVGETVFLCRLMFFWRVATVQSVIFEDEGRDLTGAWWRCDRRVVQSVLPLGGEKVGELVLFQHACSLDGFWAAGIGVSGTEVMGKLSASDEWWSWCRLKRTSSNRDGDTKSMIRWVEADVARTKVWMCSRRCSVISFPAEYESEGEERVRWLFIRILELALLRCGPTPETLLYELQMLLKWKRKTFCLKHPSLRITRQKRG